MEKDAKFDFNDDCLKAFKCLKGKLIEAPIMVAPDWTLPFEVMCDASGVAVGAVLGQRKEKLFHPIYYATLLESSHTNTSDSVASSAKPDIYTSYRKLKTQVRSDYLELKSLSLGANWIKDIGFCGKERESYVPCYNVSANLLAGLKNGKEFDRHCELSSEQTHCLVRSMEDYKIPLTWPAGRDVIWSGNVRLTKDQFLSSGSMTKSVKDHSHLIAEMIGLGSGAEFLQAGVRTVLDIGCGFGSFGAHLLSLKLMALCVAAYESSGSQVQFALERGLPAIIGNFVSKQLPFPPLSYDMVHCAQCGIIAFAMF
ncbi:putative methyltransferase PMT5 [Capsicum baccatum]|uniref:Methyltransferase n=1 Tax=Capsicum baccatum TaxID=33114 RepID=A0A2G2XPN4_CAPBA|nr:putative methyltransferase PMT5 [Capsicum baccatum]